MIINSQFRPAWWLKNPHLQTIYPRVMGKKTQDNTRQERLELPDGDFIDLVWADDNLPLNSPLVIFLHGLGGNIDSSYVSGQLSAYNQCGMRALFMHFRGASSEPNRLAPAYHSGETKDLDYLLQQLKIREPNTAKAIVGISLGGNVLLKWLGEQGQQDIIKTAVAISVPFQLDQIADTLNTGIGKLYQKYLITSMRKVYLRKEQSYPEHFVNYQQALRSVKTFWEFDAEITAPIFGFNNVHHYYDTSSCRQYLRNIATDTLIIHSTDDPFMSPNCIPTASELSSSIVLELSNCGGHVGFVAQNERRQPYYWLEQRVPRHLAAQLGL